jgi:PAS domain S-box-containing protein
LHKDLEQTIAVHETNRRAQRIRAGLDIIEIINRQSTRTEVLRAFAREIIARMDLDLALVAEAGQGGPRLIQSLGSIPGGINPEALIGQKNPLQYSLSHGETLLISNIEENPTWKKAPLLRSLGAKAFICLPITTNSHPESCVLALSRSVLPAFTPDDEQLWEVLARQAATALQNLQMLAETRRRLREVNLFLEFSRQVSSVAALREPAHLLQILVESARQAVPAIEAGMVTSWDPDRQCLVSRAAVGFVSPQRLGEISFPAGNSLPGQVFEHGQPLLVDEVNFAQHYKLSPDGLLCYRDATGGKLPVSSLVVPIMAANHSGQAPDTKAVKGVLVLDNYQTLEAFSPDDQALITSLTQQTALILDNIRLYQDSQQRTDQLRALTSVAATITSSLQRVDLVSLLLDQLQAVIPYDTGTLWLRQDNRLIVHAARGFEDADERIGLSVALEDSRLFEEMIAESSPISVGNTRSDARFPEILEYARLSWLGVPLLAKGNVIGVIALEKTEGDFYSAEDIQLVKTFASQAGVALENADLYEESQRRAKELDQRSQRLGLLNRLSTELGKTLDISQILEVASQELLLAVNCSIASVVLWESPAPPNPDAAGQPGQRRPILVSESPGSREELPLALPHVPLFEHLSQSLGVFISEEVDQEIELAPLAGYLAARATHALLVLPVATGEIVHGLLLLHVNYPYHFNPGEVELARTICNQAAIALENARLFAETLRLTDELDQRVQERTAQLGREHRRTETLLRIITEISASLDLEQVLHRTLGVLNEAIGAAYVTCLIYRPGEAGLRHIASAGYPGSPPVKNLPFALDKEYGLVGWVVSKRTPVMIGDVLQDERWTPVPGLERAPRSAMAVPLLVGEELLGALLLFHPQVDYFSDDQLDLVRAAANQVAVAVNNAELYTLIRDQAEDLGILLRNQQVETSRSRAILEAVAEGVLVTDADRRITLFNPSAQQILGLDREQLLGRSLEHFTGLFGGAAKDWIQTIHTWSADPSTYQPGETYAEQIALEDGQVVSVNLAPVLFRDEFLGTVSIFHDITHQVEVDRLKTEFVATVSHELRTPMTSIKGYVEILLMGAAGALNEQQVHFLKVVNQNTERLGILVNDLLDISRIDSGRLTLALQPLDLTALAEGVMDELGQHARAENKSMGFGLDIPPDLPRVMGDPEGVRQIVANLLSNAYYYTPENGHISLVARQVDGYIQVDVTDTGIGIPIAEQTRVFERFYRGENPLVLATSGTGLGLSMVQQLVTRHTGRIWLESSGIPGEGSTFSFTLPVYNRLMKD